MSMKELGKGQDEKILIIRKSGLSEYGLVIAEGKKLNYAFYVNNFEHMKHILEKALKELEEMKNV